MVYCILYAQERELIINPRLFAMMVRYDGTMTKSEADLCKRMLSFSRKREDQMYIPFYIMIYWEYKLVRFDFKRLLWLL